MGNHFHLLPEVPDKEAALEGMGEDDLFGRLSVLSSEIYTRRLLSDVTKVVREGVAQCAGLKQKVTGIYNSAEPHWRERGR